MKGWVSDILALIGEWIGRLSRRNQPKVLLILIGKACEKLVALIGFKAFRYRLHKRLSSFQHASSLFTEGLGLYSKRTLYTGGNCAIDVFREAKETILITHFSEDSMSPRYIKAQEKAMARGVRVRRIIPRGHLHVPDKYYKWAAKFPDHYRVEEYDGTPLPLDFVVADDQKVLMVMPTHPEAPFYTVAMTFEDDVIAGSFRAMFDALQLFLPKSGSKDNPNDLAVKDPVPLVTRPVTVKEMMEHKPSLDVTSLVLLTGKKVARFSLPEALPFPRITPSGVDDPGNPENIIGISEHSSHQDTVETAPDNREAMEAIIPDYIWRTTDWQDMDDRQPNNSVEEMAEELEAEVRLLQSTYPRHTIRFLGKGRYEIIDDDGKAVSQCDFNSEACVKVYCTPDSLELLGIA